jgi:hypothetical protein
LPAGKRIRIATERARDPDHDALGNGVVSSPGFEMAAAFLEGAGTVAILLFVNMRVGAEKNPPR